MSDGMFDYRSEPPRRGSWLAALVPLAVFLVVGVFLAIGLTLNPREIPSPLTPQMLQDTVLPLVRELRK